MGDKKTEDLDFIYFTSNEQKTPIKGMISIKEPSVTSKKLGIINIVISGEVAHVCETPEELKEYLDNNHVTKYKILKNEGFIIWETEMKEYE